MLSRKLIALRYVPSSIASRHRPWITSSPSISPLRSKLFSARPYSTISLCYRVIRRWNLNSLNYHWVTASRQESKTTRWLNAACRGSGYFTTFSMNLMRSASLSIRRRVAIGTVSCIAWRAITGTANTGFAKLETTRALKMSLVPLRGIRVILPINANPTGNETSIYRPLYKQPQWPNGSHCLSTATQTRLTT